LLVVAGAALASALVVRARDDRGATKRDTRTDGATVEVGAARGVPLTGHPPARTSVPAAAAAYAMGLASIRDGAVELGVHSFVRAAKIDPALAAAQLRVALYAPNAPTAGILPVDARDALAMATRSRNSLDERDRTLLRIAEVLNAELPEYQIYASRAQEATDKYPLDVEIGAQQAIALGMMGRLEEARTQYTRLLELDPGFAFSLLRLGWWEFEFRRDEQAIALFDRCLGVSPTASSCIRGRASVLEARGDCTAVESEARRALQIEPTSPASYELLARALAGRGASIESVRLALDRMVALGADLSPLYSASVENYWLALLEGDLLTSEASLLEIDRATTRETSGSFHETIVDMLTKLAIARGETDTAAARFYADVERLAPARASDSPSLLSTLRLYERHRAQRLADAEFVKERERRYRQSLALWPAPEGSFDADRTWIGVFVEHARTKDEMQDAVRQLDAHGSLHDEWGLTGAALLSVGRVDDAIAVLRPAAMRCGVIPETAWAVAGTTRWWLETRRLLGEALEAKGDKANACAAYAVIVERWKNPKPRSVTVEQAKDQQRALGCSR
jgi:eukaryotic-like serine/threonine-protein kinase